MKEIRWGIMSTANIALTEVVPAIRRTQEGEVAAIASKSKAKAAAFQAEKVYDHYVQLLEDESIQAIYIPLPNSLHAEWAIKAMDYGKHVLLEKPATLSEKDMQLVKKAAEDNDVVFMEAFMYQFHRQHERVKQLLREKQIGEVRHFKAHFSYTLEDRENIRMQRELGGGAMWDVGCYGIHAATQIAQFKPNRIVMHGKFDQEEGVDLTSTCMMFDEENRIAEITASMELPFMNRYEIIGERGSILVEDSFRPDIAVDRFGKVIVKDENGSLLSYERIHDDQYLRQIQHFHECIRTGEKPHYNKDQSLMMIRYLERAYESFHQGATVLNIQK